MFARYGRDPHALDGVGTVVVGSNLGLSRERRLHTGLCLDDLEADVRSSPRSPHWGRTTSKR